MAPSNISSANLHALVCGSTQGIGWACAQAFAEEGVSVTLLGRDEQRLAERVKELADLSSNHPNCKHFFLVADFSKPEIVRQVVQGAINSGAVFHVLVNNTGGPAAGKLIEAEGCQLVETFNAHLICSHYLAQALVPGMKSSGFGRIINIVSTSVKTPLPNLGVSNTIRAAVANWAKTLANELGEFGITVNNVLPGATETARLSTLIEKRAKNLGRSVDAVRKEMMAEVPLRRFAQAQEIAAAVKFLASPAAAYITGINLPVDGGRTGSL